MRTRCLQLSVDAARWPDSMLTRLEVNGKEGHPQEAREQLLTMKKEGFEVVPCGIHKCDAKGKCSGKPL